MEPFRGSPFESVFESFIAVAMKRDIYTIARSESGWTLHLNGRVLEAFDDEDRARRAASVAARLSRARGRTAQIKPIDQTSPGA
jgi:hypothetical protein